ncbi:thioesterase superfamily protein [Streptococcus porcinus]|uniref:thioesterase family protein n=1 Tax=Streptococcus porcinus TaxID=1340 RepID=UPI0010CABF6A|nr:thioesterase family protein [Streptococcus porcinus]VTS22207.1 thioesterase superfamily protein [Streptococcus porcinus]
MAIYSKVYETRKEHSAKSVGSGELEVLSTPSLVSFLENAACLFAKERIQDNLLTTVGTKMTIDHLKASKIGNSVTVLITEVTNQGRRYDFQLEAFVDKQLIAKAYHTRVRLNKEAFLQKL